MRVFIAAAAAVLVLGACGSEGDPDAAADQAGPNGDVSQAIEGCEFIDLIRLPTAEGEATPAPLSDADIDRAVEAAPGEIDEDVRIILETARDIQAKSQELAALPPEEQAARTSELSEVIQREEYRASLTAFSTYVQENCTGSD